jgi:hypothetical protein
VNIETVVIHRNGPTDTAYIATDGRMRLYDDFPARYTPEALLNRVNYHVRENPQRFDYVTHALAMTRQVQDTADWGTITRPQARAYCKMVGVPRPVWAGDHPDPKVQDALDQLALEAEAGAEE